MMLSPAFLLGIGPLYVDSFTDGNGVDQTLSESVHFDEQRTCWTPARSFATAFLGEEFDSLGSWAPVCSGSGSAVVVNPFDTDPMIGNVVQLDTGNVAGSAASVQKHAGSIAASFGVMMLVRLNQVGADPAEAFIFQVQNAANKNLQLRLRDNSVEIFQDGAWRLLGQHGGNYVTEWWLEAQQQIDGAYRVSLYGGTEFFATRTGFLPDGPAANSNLVVLQQASGPNNFRRSQVAALQIGTTQLPDNMRMVSRLIQSLPQAKTAEIMVLDEDVSRGIVPNGNFIVSLSPDEGQTWAQVVLEDQGVCGVGEIDNTKPLRMFTGGVAFAAMTRLRYKIESSGGFYHAVHRVSVGTH
jgi:hypothetical protein